MSKPLVNYIKKNMEDELLKQYNSLIKSKGIKKMTKNELLFIIWIKTGDVVPSHYSKKEIVEWLTDPKSYYLKDLIQEIRDERLNHLL